MVCLVCRKTLRGFHVQSVFGKHIKQGPILLDTCWMLAKGPFQRSRNLLKKSEKSPKSFDFWFFLWCTGAIQIRTGSGGAQGRRALHFTKIYSFSSVLVIARNYDLKLPKKLTVPFWYEWEAPQAVQARTLSCNAPRTVSDRGMIIRWVD